VKNVLLWRLREPDREVDPGRHGKRLWSRQGSCAGLEFKASFEKSLNFIKLKMSLNCFGK